MRCVVLTEVKRALELQERPDPRPASGEVVVELRAAALNRRDYWITRGKYPGVRTPVVLGSDGAGVVVAVGPDVDASLEGREVVINPGIDWGDDSKAQGPGFRILGMPDDGTFATHVVVPSSYVYSKPSHLGWQEAAALPLAGLTAFRAVFTQGTLQSGERVLVTGVGGGVATFALEFALAAGAEVSVTSAQGRKLERARELGAAATANYRESGWAERLGDSHGPFDVIVDSAGGSGYAQLMELAAPGGRIVNYGATAGPPEKLDLFKLFWKQLRLIGSTMGSPGDFRRMLDFVNEHEIRPIVDSTHPLEEANAAIESMESSPQFGKIVLEM